MTQIIVGGIEQQTVPSVPRVPRPRQRLQAPPAQAAPAAGRPVPAVTVVPPVLSPRRGTSTLATALDAALALALAGAAAALGQLSVLVAAAAAATWPVLLWTTGHYRRPGLGESRLTQPLRVLGTGLRAVVLALALSSLLVSVDTVDTVGLVTLLTVFSVASAVISMTGVGRSRPRVVLAGRPRDVREALAELRRTSGHEVVAACLTRSSKVSIGDLPTHLGFEATSAVAAHHRADALVVLPGARLTHAQVRRLHWSLAGVGTDLYLGTGLLDVEPQRTRVVSAAGVDMLHVTSPVLHGPRRLLKDVVERSLALVVLVALLPLLAFLCLAIRRESVGPALFRQERIGRHNVPFTMFKLRSMGVEAEDERSRLTAYDEGNGVLFKIQLDPRITPLGQWLRRYSLDELPQLWNVVRGDMSLVGPRPALPCEVARYDVDPQRRLVVKPGVTGLWQVSGRSDLSWDESVRLDLRYVDNWSLRLDLSILARTLQAVVGHRGAY
ncbi:exopolysaccharide biosynthesis polyprenyl glycosylphosphotransferase [Nocardioides glacieisoli]|uniref:Exopolysaccharide biosynthesis polyprenyl glycosylphosphotransferase n=1 Tax=Nocardioides glacieisoli TaxID=1168730 RepID=A0A4Q2RUR5_9ACTN|nr:exopolysaccharide biosynthesis polyprenyl glycosylphosphotransferase [Nocardioides glacieisoli]RYB92588.1 exopolysaccharide biosynthesis polyprenyl glycosylphosphotransferase [Nocardioides glacieisoli]